MLTFYGRLSVLDKRGGSFSNMRGKSENRRIKGLKAVDRLCMELRTKVFDVYNGKYRNLSDLAKFMGISRSQLCRVRQGKRSIGRKFIIGVLMAFPEYAFGDLFYLVPAVSE